MPTPLGLIPIARPTFDVPLAEQKTAQVREALTGAGFELRGPAELVMDADSVAAAIRDLQADPPPLLVLLQASFADSTMAVQIARAIDRPLLLWALPEERVGGRLRLNSFCGINLAGHGLRRAGFTYEYVYAEPDDADALNTVQVTARAAAVKHNLTTAKIGRIGENPDGFDTCLFDAVGLKERLGLDVVQVQLGEVFDGAKQAAPEAVTAAEAKVKSRVAGVESMEPEATRGTLSTYVTLRELADERGLHGLAVRCWPEFFTEMGCSACGAMSMMSDESVPASCEADVNGTITQLMLQWLSGEPAFGSDVVSFDVEEDIAVLWHCGLAPLSMADPDAQPEATIHSNRQMPLLMQFPLKPGRVTIARLSEASGEFRLVIGTGEMLKAPPAFTGTTGTLRFDNGAAAVLETIMREGLEHHVSLTYGDHVEALEVLARMLHLPVLHV